MNGLGCVAELPSPQPFPFDDSFPSTTFDGTKWTWRYTSATDISPNGSNEPSAPNAMRLRSFGSAQFRDGEVRSNFIQLQGQSSLVLDFHLQRVGVESGESLTVEYNAAFGGWQPLLVVVSDGVSQTEFDHHTIPLPALAYHNEFRVRFKVEGNDLTRT